MFRSARRPFVYPQAEHARLAGDLARVFGNETFVLPEVEAPALIDGVRLHDRGFGLLDADPLLEMPVERWLDLQRASFDPRSENAAVDAIVALHVRRIVSWNAHPAAARLADELAARLPALLARAHMDSETAKRVDTITELCDGVAFSFCFETPTVRTIDVRAGADVIGVEYRVDGEGTVVLDPWPLAVDRVDGRIIAFAARGYPNVLRPLAVPYAVVPASSR